MQLSQVVHLILEGVVGLLEVKKARLQLPPMGNARLSTEAR
jgi:hypothetical protein